jgi:hypothetical protein
MSSMSRSLAIMSALSTIVLGVALVWISVPALCQACIRALAALGG